MRISTELTRNSCNNMTKLNVLLQKSCLTMTSMHGLRWIHSFTVLQLKPCCFYLTPLYWFSNISWFNLSLLFPNPFVIHYGLHVILRVLVLNCCCFRKQIVLGIQTMQCIYGYLHAFAFYLALFVLVWEHLWPVFESQPTSWAGKTLYRSSPVVLNPNSRGQETAKARTQTVAIMTETLLRELWVVLYSTGITTAIYLHRSKN